MNNLMKLIVNGSIIAALTATALPAAAETVAPNTCTTRNAEAAMTSNVPMDLSPIAALVHPTGTAVVEIDLDAQGKPAKTAIVKSSGWRSADAAAEKSVVEQTYTPAIRDCSPVPSAYAVTVQF